MAQVRMTGASSGTGPLGSRTCHFPLWRSTHAYATSSAMRGMPGGTPEGKEPLHMLGEIIAAIVIGIIAGYVGRALLPGDDSMGFVATIAVGIVGALIGYFVFRA